MHTYVSTCQYGRPQEALAMSRRLCLDTDVLGDTALCGFVRRHSDDAELRTIHQ